ncbi:MAG TPA: signal peptidase I [Gaiellaceae bacterium]|nr:signal peptidase I [Gaiellaceae bacterium]
MARKKTIASGTIAVAVAALLWLFLAPVQLGGPIDYTTTVGNSMAPRFHKGDLALVRPASTYRVGDVVLYESPVLHRAVLHRILLIQNGHYFFKGDNNSFVDPGYATRGDLLGKLWLRVPAAGGALAWIAEPAHAALVCAGAVFALLFGAFGGTVRRRRRATPRERRATGTVVALRRALHRPRKTRAFYAGAVALLLGLVLVPVAFLSPARRTVALAGAYQSTGTFAYSANVTSSAAYPDGTIHTGQPLYLTLAKTADVSFAYRFESALAHQVHGTIALRARISSGGWQHTYPLHARVRFAGDRAVVRAKENLRDLQTLAQQLAVESGSVGVAYDVTLEPVVTVAGVVGGRPIASTFAPTLPFTLSSSVLAPAPPQAELPVGAESPTKSAATALDAALHPAAPGSIPVHGANYLTIARYHLADSTGRWLGLVLVALGLAGCLSGQFRRRRDVWSNERRIAFRYGCLIADVASLPNSGEVVEMADFEQLATLAQHLDRPILREARRIGDLYAVEDVGRRYCFRANPTLAPSVPGASDAPPPAPPAALPAARRDAGGQSLALRASGLFVIFAITVAAATAFTAGNTVPNSYASRTQQATSAAALTPDACASLGITGLASGSGSFSNSTSHRLLIGSSGSDTIVDHGSYDCIVGGAGQDTVWALGSHDVCIANTNSRSTYYNCTKS